MSRSEASKAPTKTHRLPMIILTAATIACLLPFIGKAFHMDDPLFIWVAQHIRAHPLDPYGFQVNWYGTNQQMWEVTQNPPLACYYIALASCFVGWSEVGIHAFMILPAIAAVLGAYQIGRRLCSSPLLVALIALLTPVFLISGTTVMCDILMLAFWVWAIVFWMQGMEEERGSLLAISAVMIASAAMSKYYGAALIPLLLTYSILKKRRMGWWATYLLIPVAVLGLYQLVTHAMYGKGLLASAAAYANTYRYISIKHLADKALIGLAFAGGCFAPALFCAPMAWSRKAIAVGLALTVGTAAVLAHMGALGIMHLRNDSHAVLWSPIIHISLLAAAGLGVLAMTVRETIRRRDAETIVLGLWIVFTFLFAVVINWSVNGRSLLPAVPAIGILLVRAIESRNKTPERGTPRWCYGLLIPAAILGLWTSYGDYCIANAWRRSAESVVSAHTDPRSTTYVQGHWGFQYYAEKAGAVEMDLENCVVVPGDILVVPFDNTNVAPLPRDRITGYGLASTPVGGRMATMSAPAGAGFYSDAVGSTPFLIGKVPDIKADSGVATRRFILCRSFRL